MVPPRVLVIAGSDSSGGAGLEADQKVLAAHGCYAMTATTALTAQRTTGVDDIHVIPPLFLKKQIAACIEDVGVDVVKLGMLASKETINVVAESLASYKVSSIVLDPVMVATSGAQLLPQDAVAALREKLLPMASVLTPNIPEALLLLRDAGVATTEPQNMEEINSLARKVQNLGPKAVFLKGGHMPLTKDLKRAESKEKGERLVDVLYDGQDFTIVESEYSTSRNTHGTGCSLASAIASNLAKGGPLPAAVRLASQYVHAGIRLSFDLGKGNGPINHFHSLQYMPFSPGRFIDYLLERDDVKNLWHDYTHHPFVQGIRDGSLPLEAFKRFLIQDYLYLTHFARSHALAASKALDIDTIAASASVVVHIQHEMGLHLDYCQQFGLSKAEIEKQKESIACVAYSRWVLDVGRSEDVLALQVAMAPCLLGYGKAATWLFQDVDSVRENNLYWKWVENYVAEDYREAVKVGSALLEKLTASQSPSRIEQLVKIFQAGTEMEIEFWNSALRG